MDALFGSTFDKLAETLQGVLDKFTNSFSSKMDNSINEFTTQLNDLMLEFSEQLSNSFTGGLDDLANSTILNDFINQIQTGLEQILTRYMLITSIPSVLALIAVVISIINISKTKKIALFDKRIEVYTALEFLINCKNIENTTENQIRLMKLEDQMLIISKAQFIFDENLTNEIYEYTDSVYGLMISNDNSSNSSIIEEKSSIFRTNTLPKIKELIKI